MGNWRKAEEMCLLRLALLPHNLARVKNRDTNSSTMKGKCLARASSYGHVARGVQHMVHSILGRDLE
jgi:hypothetical protein